MRSVIFVVMAAAALATACSSTDPRLSYQVTGEQGAAATPSNSPLGVKAAAPTFDADDPVP